MFKKLVVLSLAWTFVFQAVSPSIAFASEHEGMVTHEVPPIYIWNESQIAQWRSESSVFADILLEILDLEEEVWLLINNPDTSDELRTYLNNMLADVSRALSRYRFYIFNRGFQGGFSWGGQITAVSTFYDWHRWFDHWHGEPATFLPFEEAVSILRPGIVGFEAVLLRHQMALGIEQLPVDQEGWVQVDGHWFFYEDGVRQVGWLLESGSWFYLNPEGVMQTGWVHTSGSWFFLAGSGRMQTGWLRRGTNWYFLASSGRMQTGWLQRGNNWYFLASSGRMQTGWLRRGTNWYFLASSGRMQTGWVQVGSNWFFMNNSGRMQTGRVVINGVVHLFNGSGVWQGRG